MKLLSGPASITLGKKIAEMINLEELTLGYKLFFDKETYLRITGKLDNEDVILVQNTAFPQEKHFVELILLAQTLKEMGAAGIIAVIPYLCYARADRRRLEGEVISHKILLELLEKVGITAVITINVHNTAAFIEFAPSIEKYDINAFQFLANQLKEKHEENWIVVGPDKGSAKNAKIVAEELGTDYYVLEKFRDPETHEVKFKPPNFNCENKNVLLVDDIVSSGGTVIKATKLLKDHQASSVSLLVVHSVATKPVIEKMKKEGIKKIYISSTIPPSEEIDVDVIDITPLLAQFIKEKFL